MWRTNALLALQAFQVVFLWLHDWVPVPPLNDVKAVHDLDGTGGLLRITLIQAAPFTVGLVFSALTIGHPYPHWLFDWLWISYGILFVGQLQAWWLPYLFGASAKRVQRNRVMFGRTHSFLPERNGIVPNTLHCLLHAATLATLIILLAGS